MRQTLHTGKYGQSKTILFALIDRGTQDFENTPVTFSAGDVKIIKDEGSAANTTNLPTHEGNGVYSLVLDATEMEAARIAVTLIDSATKAWEDHAIFIETYGNVSAEHLFDLDSANPDVNVKQISGDATAADNCELFFDGTGYAGGTARLKTDQPFKKNVALSNFPFQMIDSADSKTPKTGLTVSGSISKNGGAFAALTNDVSEISNGFYKVNLTATELNANTVVIRFTASGANDTAFILFPTNPS